MRLLYWATLSLMMMMLLSSSQAIPTCMICTLIVTLVEEVAIEQKTNIPTAVNLLCNDLPLSNLIGGICDGFLSLWSSALDNDFKQNKSPDYSCQHTIKFCNDPNYQQCQLFKQWPPSPSQLERNNHYRYQPEHYYNDELLLSSSFTNQHLHNILTTLAMIGLTPSLLSSQPSSSSSSLQRNDPFTRAFKDHLPGFDNDNDNFSTVDELRGSHWRGKDCNDNDNTIYPGRQQTSHPSTIDHNCNGIFGNNDHQQSYEDQLCKDSQQRGIIALGDSATAHFRIPPEYLDGFLLNNKTYNELLPLLLDEADWPQCSWSTGHPTSSSSSTTDECPPALLPLNSIYQRLRQQNHCNHRDYQNIGVNGARVVSMAPPNGIITSMKSRNVTDYPAIVTFALVGNDVCDRYHDFDHMTTPEQFEQSVLDSLQYLDDNLSPGSYVIAVGLADGRILYDVMSNLTHPLGATYADFYDYLNCFDTSPCWGWMNTNSTVRDLTWQRTQELNNVYDKLSKTSKNNYKNFEFLFYDSDFDLIIQQWIKDGHQASDLIEPTDGFHPSQDGNMLLADSMWKWLEQNYPDVIGPINNNNQLIEELFGNQGGY